MQQTKPARRDGEDKNRQGVGKPKLGAICKIPRLENTWNLGERKGKEGKIHNKFPTMHAHRQRRRRRRKNVYLTLVGSAALPESEASNYTYTKVQRKTTEGTREKTEGRGETRERMKKKREREKTGTGFWGQGVGKGWTELLAPLMIVTAATSAAAGTNQHPPRADLAPSPCCARGLHSVRGHHTEPRKTCSRVRGFCNSAIMKREFVQPCAGQNSEFT